MRGVLRHYAEEKEGNGFGIGKIMEGSIKEDRLQRSIAAGDESVVEKPLGKTPPNQGKVGRASPGKKAKGRPHHRQGKG